MFGIATIEETARFYRNRIPFSGVPIPFSTRQWEYPWTFQIMQRVGVSPGAKLLDVGCARNPFMVGLARMGFFVTGLDLYAQTDPQNPYPEFGGFDRSLATDHLSFCQADVTSRIPFDDGFFDCVYCISVLEHLAEHRALGNPHFRLSPRLRRRLKTRVLSSLVPPAFCDTFRGCARGMNKSGRERACDKPRVAGDVQKKAVFEMMRVIRPGGLLIVTIDYIPSPIKTSDLLPGVLEPCSRKMDYDFRDIIAIARDRLADPSVYIPCDAEIAEMRDQGLLLLCAAVAPNEFYHFTSVGFAFIK
jgi:SAM-dependent methyltransferase